jgi:hypothetical protein
MSAAELLFPNRYRRSVLAVLFMAPDRRVHLRELARLTRASPGTLKKELDALTQAGLLHMCKVGNQTQFGANVQHPVFPELSGLIRKTIGLHDVLALALQPLRGQLDVAFVFGSIAGARESTYSDVDVMAIGNASFGQVANALYDAQTVIGREINPKVMTREEWLSKRGAGNAFVGEVMNQPKLFIVGSADDL